MLQTLKPEDLKQQFGGPNNRNKADKFGIESVLKPYVYETANIHITSDGKIIGKNSDEAERMKIIDPQILNKILMITSPGKES